MAQGMHANIKNILVSKRLDRWRRHISEKRSKSRIYCIPVKPFIWFQTTAKKKTDGKTENFHIFFPIFSPSFLPIFSNFSKWQKWNVSITGQQTFARTLSRSKPLFARMNSCCAKNAWFSGCTASASTNPVPGVAMSLKHLIYDISCVCVRMNFSAICRLAPCLWDMGISKHKRRNATTRPVHLNSTGLFLQKQGVRRWNEAIFSCSTKASNSFTQNARQIETGRSGKREAKKWLYKIQPLRQQKAIGTIFIGVTQAFAHSCLPGPIAILQREGFWQHKGLGKRNAISVASSILTCNGLATLKGSPLGGRCPFWRLEWSISLPFQWPHSRNNPTRQWWEHLQWTSLCFLHYRQLCWASCLTTLAYTHKPWTHRTCCWQGNSAD